MALVISLKEKLRSALKKSVRRNEMDKETLRKNAEQFFEDNLVKIASVGHGGLAPGPQLTGGAGIVGLRPTIKNEDLEETLKLSPKISQILLSAVRLY